MSFGGTLNSHQPALIQATVEQLSSHATVRIATDSDKDGADFATAIEGLVVDTGRRDMVVTQVMPDGAKDWNDSLRGGRDHGG